MSSEGRSDEELVATLRSAVTKLARSQRMEAMRAAGMPYSHMTLLSALEREGRMTPTELAAAEGVRKPVMTRSLSALAERGFIRREEHPSDGRQAVISLSANGTRALHGARRAINEWYEWQLGQLGEGEREALRRAAGALARLADQVDSHAYVALAGSRGRRGGGST